MERLPKIALPVIFLFIAGVIIVSKSAITIGSGEAGVLYRTFADGVVTDKPPMGEGFHLVAPWNKVYIYEVRQQAIDEEMNVLSSNGLGITIKASILYQPRESELGKLHKEKSEDYVARILLPSITSAARSVVGRYTPLDLYSSKRDVIQNEIYLETKKLVEDQYIDLNKVLVRDITLPVSIKEAIEKKLEQEQIAEEYEFKLQTARSEAEKQRIEAQGKADANRILSASLTDKILQDKGIDATLKLAESPNAKVIVVGSGESGLPLILGNN